MRNWGPFVRFRTAFRVPCSVSWSLGRIIGLLRFVHVLAADGGVFFDAAVPSEAGGDICEGNPESLDDEAADEVGAGGFAHVNADGKIELVGEGSVKEDLLETA